MTTREHFVIPDTQVKPGVKTNHLIAAANYIAAKQPDVIIHLGDHWDMHSLSSYDRGTKNAEGARYDKDIKAGNAAIEEFEKVLRRRRKYKPRKIFLIGNHEQRIERHVSANPELHGTLSYDNFNLKENGWEVHAFLKPVCIDGVHYAHYFYNPLTGHPWGGKASTKLTNIGFSFTQGHVQGKDQSEKYLANGRTLRGLVAGSFYQHNEKYKGPQANRHWRGCIYKHEVRQGDYDQMELSLRYLLEKWL